MSKLLLAAFNTCLWITLLALVITGVIRVGVEAMERRVQHQATLHSARELANVVPVERLHDANPGEHRR